MRLDHLVVAGSDLGAASEYAERSLGLPLRAGGQHALFGTHNRLLGFAGAVYFEAIAIDPAAHVQRPRWFGLDRFTGPPRLVTWVAAVDDLAAACRIWPEAGEIVELARGDLRWRMAVPRDGALHFGGAMPMLIEWQGDLHPSAQLGQDGGALVQLAIQSPLAQQVSVLLAELGLDDPRISISQSDECRLVADIDTPNGRKTIA